MARKKTWQEKLETSNDLPKVVQIEGKLSQRWGAGTCAIPAPRDVDALMKRVRKGKLATTHELRAAIAAKHGATMACPITTGIFAWIAAHVAAEAEEAGQAKTIAWWRTLKTGGELNPKFPGGIERQKRLLEAEGHRVVAKGKKFVVADYERRLVKDLA